MLFYSRDIYDYIFEKIKTYLSIHEAQQITKMILEKKCNCSVSHFLTNEQINIDNLLVIDDIILRLKKNEPIQYILESVSFCDIDLYVDKNVFIPRPETEEMVYDIFNTIDDFANKNIIDLCTGSGCIAIALKRRYSTANVFALDINKKALNIAQKNANRYNLNIKFINEDIFNDSVFNVFKSIKFDLIVSNPPYVCNSEKENIAKRVLSYEPQNALFVPDSDYLIFYKRIKHIAQYILGEKGVVFLEINERFGNQILALFEDCKCSKKSVKQDFNKKDRWFYLEK